MCSPNQQRLSKLFVETLWVAQIFYKLKKERKNKRKIKKWGKTEKSQRIKSKKQVCDELFSTDSSSTRKIF